MMFENRDKRSDENPRLQLVPLSCASDDVGCHFSALIALLEEPQLLNAELRQLWLETHWLKSDFEQNVLTLPTNWDLMVMEIAEDKVSANIQQHVEIVQAAKRLGFAIKNYLAKLAN
jgi:hypothetical protein